MNYTRKIKSVLLYLECGHNYLFIPSISGRKIPTTLRCCFCNPKTRKKIVKHGIKLALALKRKKP